MMPSLRFLIATAALLIASALPRSTASEAQPPAIYEKGTATGTDTDYGITRTYVAGDPTPSSIVGPTTTTHTPVRTCHGTTEYIVGSNQATTTYELICGPATVAITTVFPWVTSTISSTISTVTNTTTTTTTSATTFIEPITVSTAEAVTQTSIIVLPAPPTSTITVTSTPTTTMSTSTQTAGAALGFGGGASTSTALVSLGAVLLSTLFFGAILL